jgi:hypothetical protein
MKCVSVAALLGSIVLGSSQGYSLALRFVVASGAALVACQAALANKYSMSVFFATIAVLYNPIVRVPLGSPSGLWLDLAALAMFGVSLTVLRVAGKPRLSMPSITDRTPGSESL